MDASVWEKRLYAPTVRAVIAAHVFDIAENSGSGFAHRCNGAQDDPLGDL